MFFVHVVKILGNVQTGNNFNVRHYLKSKLKVKNRVTNLDACRSKYSQFFLTPYKVQNFTLVKNNLHYPIINFYFLSLFRIIKHYRNHFFPKIRINNRTNFRLRRLEGFQFGVRYSSHQIFHVASQKKYLAQCLFFKESVISHNF